MRLYAMAVVARALTAARTGTPGSTTAESESESESEIHPADAVYQYFKSKDFFAVDASRPTEAPQPGVPLPAVGARVMCQGLTGAAELNGCLGRVVRRCRLTREIQVGSAWKL